MKQTLTTAQAIEILLNDPDAGWTYFGAKSLIEWLQQLEADCGAEIEFDPVAIREEWSEFDSAIECAAGDYNWRAKDFPELLEACKNDPDNADELMEQHALEWLSEQTQVVGIEAPYANAILVRNF